MVANIGEILEPDEEDEPEKEGSGFNVKKADAKDKK